MNTIEALKTKRSFRSFTGEQIPYETVMELITIGTMASTGSNLQPWGFAVEQDKETIEAMAKEIKAYAVENLDKFPHFRMYEKALKSDSYNVLNDATTMIFIYADTNSHWYVYDGSLAAGNIMLAAYEMGLGACWIGWCESFCNTSEFKAKYNVPENYALVAALSCGYPTEKLGPPTRKPPVIFSK